MMRRGESLTYGRAIKTFQKKTASGEPIEKRNRYFTTNRLLDHLIKEPYVIASSSSRVPEHSRTFDPYNSITHVIASQFDKNLLTIRINYDSRIFK